MVAKKEAFCGDCCFYQSQHCNYEPPSLVMDVHITSDNVPRWYRPPVEKTDRACHLFDAAPPKHEGAKEAKQMTIPGT